MLDANASLLPKEAFDKGWRKVVVVIVLNIIICLGCYLVYSLGGNHAIYIISAFMTLAIVIDCAYLGINIKQHLKEFREVLPIVQEAIRNQTSKPNSKEES